MGREAGRGEGTTVKVEAEGPRRDRPSPRRLLPEERMPQILDAALAEFAERGYGGARMAAVATRAGIAKSLIYHYFPSKADLFQATVRAFTQPIMSKVERHVAEIPASAFDQMRVLVEIAYRQIGDAGSERQLLKLFITESERFPELARLYREEVHVPGMGIIERLLKAGAASGEFRAEVAETPFFAEILIAPVFMASLCRMIMGEANAPDPAQMLAAHVGVLRPLLCPA